VLTATVLLGAVGAWWLAVNRTGDGSTPGSDAVAQRSVNVGYSPAIGMTQLALEGAGASNSAADSFLTTNLLQTFEAMLVEAIGSGEIGDAAVLKKRLVALLPRYFPAELITRAGAMIDRYVDYRVALGKLQPPANAGDAKDLRAALDARQRVRELYFTGEENEALFGLDSRLDSYTLARLETEQNLLLTLLQKQAALKQAELELSDSQRQQRVQAVAHMAVAAQTSAFDASGLSDAERYAQRGSQYGEAAASQLAQLDRENRDWQSRLDNYAAARATAQATQNGLEQLPLLRGQLFSELEQLRVDAALAMRQPQAASQTVTPLQR